MPHRVFAVLWLLFCLSPISSLRAADPPPGGTREQLDAEVDRVGRTPPDWFKDTPLNYPTTLDLKWTTPPPQPWNNQKNVGQFIWDVVNPNPNRWREGVRLMHHLLGLHKDNPDLRERIMLELARMYHDLLEDYVRSAFWYRAVGVEKTPEDYSHSSVLLAECYWRMGYRDEALKFLSHVYESASHAKLLGDMGETEPAIRMALAEAADSPDYAYLAAGDACRQAGRYEEALGYYQKVLEIEVPQKSPPGRLLKNMARAKANVAAIRFFELSDPKQMPDGTYTAASQGYEGAVEVAVKVAAGQIASVQVSRHREKQFYSAMTDTPSKIIAKQSVKGIDTTSNATITSEAIINATAKALAANQK